jgi:hypothetical protein
VGDENVSEFILGVCKSEIAEKFGSLDDIPYELANSLVNVYYKFTAVCINHNIQIIKDDKQILYYALGKHLQKGMDIFKAYEKFFIDIKLLEMRFKLIGDIIRQLRSLVKQNNLDLYIEFADIMLDFYKYGIEEPWHKSRFRRKIERLAKRKKVDEISDLIDLMKV